VTTIFSASLHRLKVSYLLRKTVAMLGVRGLSILIGIALSLLLARWLKPEGYGTYLFTLTIAQLLALPILAGLPTLIVRQIARARGQTDGAGLAGILRWAIWFVLLTSGTILAAAALFIILTGSGADLRVELFALPLVVALAFLQVGSAIVQGYEHPVAGNLADALIRPAILLGLVGLGVALGILDPALALSFHVAAAMIAALFTLWYWRQVCVPSDAAIPVAPPRYETRSWLSSLVPLSLITGGSMINSRLDVLMLGLISRTEEVARYGIAMQVAGLVVMGQTIVNTIVAPKIARHHSRDDRDALRNVIAEAARLSTGVALVVVLIIVWFGELIILALLGPEYIGTVQIALILSVGNLISSMMGPVAKVLNMTGNERTTARLVWISAVANGALNLALVPIYGATGAAIATVAGQVLHQLAMTWWVAARLGFDTTILGRRLEV